MGRRTTGASATGAVLATSGSEPGPESLRVLRFSTTTDFERPWLKFCRTWPLSTVRCSDSGLRAPPRSVLSVLSLVSVMLFSFKLRNPGFRPSGCAHAEPVAPYALGLAQYPFRGSALYEASMYHI